jgi:hypothetical protein
MELEKIADGLVKSAAAARTLGPIVKPGEYATWARGLKKVAEAHYAKLQTEKKAEEPAAGNFLTNTFNTLSQNYKSLDPALQNTIAGAGIGAGGGALMGLGSNLLSGRKKKNYLSDMMSMGLMGGLGGGAAGGLYSLATDPGAINRATGALGLSTPEPAAAEGSGTPGKPDINTPAGRAEYLKDKANASGLNAYSSEKAKNDAITAAEMGGAGAAVGAGVGGVSRLRGTYDPTKVTPNSAAMVETVIKNNPAITNTKQLLSSLRSPGDMQRTFGYAAGANGKVTLKPDSPLLAAFSNPAEAADAARQLQQGTMAERQALANRIVNGKSLSLTDAGLKGDAQKLLYRQANPRVLSTDSFGKALSKRFGNATNTVLGSLFGRGGAGKRLGLLGLAGGGINMANNAFRGSNSDAERGKIMADHFNELINSKQITNPAQLQQLQNLAASASQGITQAGSEFFAKKYEDILQAATAGK